jgi:hypothetical protein
MHTPGGGGGALDMPAAYNTYSSARIFIPSLPYFRRPWGLLLVLRSGYSPLAAFANAACGITVVHQAVNARTYLKIIQLRHLVP